MTFGATAKVAKLLKNAKSSDAELAAACTTTKAYKENAAFAKEVDAIISGKVKEDAPKPEPAKSNSTRGGERTR